MRKKINRLATQAVFSTRVLVTLVLVALFPTSVWAFEQKDSQPIYNDRGDVIAYVHQFEPVGGTSPESHKSPIVFLSGFEVNFSQIVSPVVSPQSGSRDRGMELLNKLKLTRYGDVYDSTTQAGKVQLLESLVDEHGYSLYILEMANPNLSIPENAEALEAFLLNADFGIRSLYQKDGTRATVLGWSMGGLVARYALSSLESRRIDHYTSLYISYDSPHKGAYLPTSLEVFVRVFEDSLDSRLIRGMLPDSGEALKNLLTQLESGAAREMLGVYVGAATQGDAFGTTLGRRYNEIESDPDSLSADPSYYNLRQGMLMLGAYPQKLRKVGISNGNMLGLPRTMQSDEERNRLISMRLSIRYRGDISWTIMDATLNDDPWSSSRSTCNIVILFDYLDCSDLKMPAELANISASPGSTVNAIWQLKRAIDKLNNSGGSVDKAPGEGYLTFIPSVSALDINSTNWFLPVDDALNLTPFDAVYANPGGNNLPHHAVSPHMESVLSDELSNTVQRHNLLNILVPAVL